MEHPFTMAILFACGLLLVGFVLRVTVRPLQVLYIPASVVGGLIGFALLQAGLRSGPAPGAGSEGVAEAAGTLRPIAGELIEQMAGWPGWLIAVVFAGLLLERSGKKFSDGMRLAARQGIVVWIITLGQVMLGLAASWMFIAPRYDVPPSFGQLIETGFAGGHGTAAAMAKVWSDVLSFDAGHDLAFFFATFGLIYGVVSGVFWVNVGVRCGWTRAGKVRVPIVRGLEARHDPKPSAFARVSGEVVDPLVFQVLIVAAAFGVGMLLQWLFASGASALVPEAMEAAERGKTLKAINNVPLFLFTLIGGWLVRTAMQLLGAGDLIDVQSIRRVVAAAMEFLIVAAIATLRIETLTAYWQPVLLLVVVGAVWAAICLLFVGRWLLPRAYWFELGLINYGMSTATTAQGLMLLRIVDPDLESGAAEDYAVAAPLSAPFIGGGVITVSLPLILERAGELPVIATALLAMAVLFGLGFWMKRGERRSEQ